MSRALFGILGVFLALLPERVARAYETAAFENPEACTAKEYLVPVIRTEGVVFALVSLAGGRAYDRLMDVTGIAGALALCFPRRYLETGASLVYEYSDALEWRGKFVTVARVLGAAFLALWIRAYRTRTNDQDWP
jgi:hypothetical protein